MLLETIFHYRTLIGKCELGCGLDWDEIEQVSRIEHGFAAGARGGRRFVRQHIELTATMRGDHINDPIDIVELGPGGLVCTRAPFIARGEIVEIVVDIGDRSYRFRAEGVWLKDDGDDYRCGLKFVGMPVCLHKVQISEHVLDVVDKIRSAAA
jgi:hypothetical protein